MGNVKYIKINKRKIVLGILDKNPKIKDVPIQLPPKNFRKSSEIKHW